MYRRPFTRGHNVCQRTNPMGTQCMHRLILHAFTKDKSYGDIVYVQMTGPMRTQCMYRGPVLWGHSKGISTGTED